jgi:hypothetical protein
MPSGIIRASFRRNAVGAGGVCGSSAASCVRRAWKSASDQSASKPMPFEGTMPSRRPSNPRSSASAASRSPSVACVIAW